MQNKATFRVLLWLSLSVFIVLENLHATESEAPLFLSYALEVAFVPEQAYFLLQLKDGSYQKVKAILIPPFVNEKENSQNKKWLVGGLFLEPQTLPNQTFSIYLRGKDKEVAYLPSLSWEQNAAKREPDSISKLKDRLKQQSEVLKSWQVQNKAQTENLQRIRADADLIADTGRIANLQDEIEIIHSEIENIDKDIKLLQDGLHDIKNIALPKNYDRRELELTKQISELAGIVKQAEANESQRKGNFQGELQRNLAIVESTRYDDEEKLRQELASLKAQTPRHNGNAPADSKKYWDLQ